MVFSLETALNPQPLVVFFFARFVALSFQQVLRRWRGIGARAFGVGYV